VTTNEAPGRAAERDSGNTSEGINLNSWDTGQQRHPDIDDCIYARGAPLYWQAGWHAPLPYPPGAKAPPLTGWTGYDGRWPNEAQISQWSRERSPLSNVGLRVNYGLVGIDVDAYEPKTGGRTLAKAESVWGPLPPTWRSTARIDDEVSGIRVFRVPVSVFFRSEIKFKELGLGDIETIQPHLRHVTAWPSTHPKTGQRYRWYGPDGRLLPEGEVPRVENIPDLPEAWVTGLAKDSVRHEVFDGSAPNRPRSSEAVVDEQVYHQLMDLMDNGVPDEVVDARLRKALLDLTSGAGSRYDTTRDHVAALMRMHFGGRVGVPSALSELFTAYVLEVTDTRPRKVAEAEFWRFTEGAALLIAATSPSDPWETMGTAGSGSGEGTESHPDTAEDGPSWCPIDLTDLLNGVREPLLPSLFERSDGQCLLYAGLVHSFHGESESGKSLIIQVECVRLINRGQKVLYLDFESDVASVVARLLDFGGDPLAVADHFRYVQPEVRPDSVEERRAWEEVLSGTDALAVIDGVTDALGIFGCSTIDNDDVAGWIRTVPKQIAARTGAAVVLIDHVTKDTSTRNRWAIGGQAKMAGLTGAAYTVEVVAPLGRGMGGEVVLKIAKDRPGAVRPHCGSFSKRDRTQEAARVIVDSTISPPEVTIAAPLGPAEDAVDGETAFRPTSLMQRASEVIEQHPQELTKNKVAEKAGGRKKFTLLAVDILYREGYVTSERGRGGHPLYTVVKPYREVDDRLSDRYVNFGNALPSE
jgi:Bifunctional DNA primase/polymerase, N-terminal/AAA domain